MFSFFRISMQIQIICKYALALFLIFSITDQAAAQNTGDQKQTRKFTDSLEIGITAGLSLNQFTKEQPQTGLNTGYTAGLLINYKLLKGISLQLEVNSLQQGGQLIRFKDDTRFDMPETFESKNIKNSSYKLNSIEVPVLINYAFKIKQVWIPSVYAGASYAYTCNVSEKYQKTGDLLAGEDIIATVSGSQNVNEMFNKSRVNLIVGANLKLPLVNRLMLLIDFRYLTGVTPARENYSYMEKAGFGSNIRTNSFLSRIGITMPLSKK